MEYVTGGHPGTTSRHPSPTTAALDQDRVTMPPLPPKPPQQRGTGPFDDAELRALYGDDSRDRGRNLTSLAACYPETARAAFPPRERDPSAIAMIVLENGHYYQVRIIPHPQESQWSLEAVDSMLLATTALPDSPTPLPNGQPPDPLTAIVSGTAGTWHPGHALYCLRRWAQRPWPHTRVWLATWRFYLDGRQQLAAIPERTAETPTATNLCPVFAIHQIRALALGEQLQPAIRTETEAQAAHAVLVHEFFGALRSRLVRRVRNPPGP